jgi:ubiquitin-conjugating enzyme E2 G2
MPNVPSKQYLLVLLLIVIVHTSGEVCISTLHSPGEDPFGYESSFERWSPVQSVEKILISVVSILIEPNDESGANVEACKMYREDRKQFEAIVLTNVRNSIELNNKST